MSRPIVEVGEVWSALFINESTYSTCRHNMIWIVSITVTGRSGSAKSRLKKKQHAAFTMWISNKDFAFSQPFSLPHYGQSENNLYFQICYMGSVDMETNDTRYSPTVDQSEPSSNVASKMLWSYSSEAGEQSFLPKYIQEDYKWIYPWLYPFTTMVFHRVCWGYNYLITWGGPSCMCI